MSNNVLFVATDEHVLSSIKRVFADLHMHIICINNPEEAVDIVQEERIGVIVSDNLMPEMKGYDLLNKVKDISPDTQRILMTAHADLPVAVDAVNNGELFRFLTKPWNDQFLMNTVREAQDRYHMIQSMRKGDMISLRILANKIEQKDPYTNGHSDRVAHIALVIANTLHVSSDIKTAIEFGSVVHDYGKISIPDKILNKNARLNDGEYEMIKNHPLWGADIATQAGLSGHVVAIVHYHHEHFDGNGYPSGLKGEKIPLVARIVTVADVYDALTSDRCYRTRYSNEKARQVMELMKGIVFDPEILDAFLSCISDIPEALSQRLHSPFLDHNVIPG